jgi:hypothetical protein
MLGLRAVQLYDVFFHNRLRDWVQRLQCVGPEGPHRRLDEGSQASPVGGATGSVRADRRGGSESEVDGGVRWHRVDLKRVIAEVVRRKLLNKLAFSHISARPRHPAQDERVAEGVQKTSRALTLTAYANLGGNGKRRTRYSAQISGLLGDGLSAGRANPRATAGGSPRASGAIRSGTLLGESRPARRRLMAARTASRRPSAPWQEAPS